MTQRSLPELLRTASPQSSHPPSAAVAGLFLDDNPVVRRHQQLLSVVMDMDRSFPTDNDQDDKEEFSPSYSMPQRPLLTSDMRKGHRSSVEITAMKPTHTIEQEIVVALHQRRMMRMHQQQQQQLGDPDDAPPAVHESPPPPLAVDTEGHSSGRLPSSCLGANLSPTPLLSGRPPPHQHHTEDRRHVARRSPSNRHPSRGRKGWWWGVFLLVLAALVLMRLQQWK